VLFLFFVLGLAMNLAIAVAAAQFANAPALSVADARERAVKEVLIHPNATHPIWPAFSEAGTFTSIVASHAPEWVSDRQGPYIQVELSAGWPLRCVRTQTDYGPGGWTDAKYSLGLLAMPDRKGKSLVRDLPLQPKWTGLLVNSLLFGLMLQVVVIGPKMFKRVHRGRRNRCPSCGYPRGSSGRCSECGQLLR
jgi:hypothetical protein